MIDANFIVQSIGKGVQAALKTNQLFLGVEQFELENADIHPEYVTTVKVAEHLTGPELIVSLEAKMNTLRRHATGIVRLKNRGSQPDRERGSELIRRLNTYKFGKSDRQRLDILVRTTGFDTPPVLVAEAKLGARNLAGIVTDIDRIVCLLRMYEEAKLLEKHRMYGAVVFHSMRDGQDTDALTRRASNLLSAIRAHLNELSHIYQWLNYKADLLRSFAISEPVYGYREFYEDGASEDVFGKDQFAFAPGLVLLGKPEDINTVCF